MRGKYTLVPGRIVARSFFHNRLAVTGLAIILGMVLFSFVGGIISPYGETEVFRKTEIFRRTEVCLNDSYARPSGEHLLGTDGNGMDILTRLMFGGRISLVVGVVVVFLEIFIGVTLGGIAGYFGGWADALIMRIVDIFCCIPGLPLYLIVGSVMDFQKVSPVFRIFVLCAMLGILGWIDTARLVRGQILYLREQEFMMAAKALGICTHRKIFVYLMPNVIPQLSVSAAMRMGNTILAEATLSFLGLGIKFPYASWGNMIGVVNDSYVMTNYWFVWVPAGILILLTVLGFHFIGDGLRDAFDPKRKGRCLWKIERE